MFDSLRFERGYINRKRYFVSVFGSLRGILVPASGEVALAAKTAGQPGTPPRGRLAAGHLLQLFWVPRAYNRDPGGRFIHFTKIVGREFD